MRIPVVADRYYVTWDEIGRPTVRGDYEVPGLGMLVFDDTDAFYATSGAGTLPHFALPTLRADLIHDSRRKQSAAEAPRGAPPPL